MISNYEKIKTIFKHKKAFLCVEKELLGKNTIDGYLHDVDKIFMLALCFWLNPKEISKIHRANSRHHLENNIEKNEKDYTQMIIDWECARYTKSDKPLNAYETMQKYYPQTKSKVLPLLARYLPNQINGRE